MNKQKIEISELQFFITLFCLFSLKPNKQKIDIKTPKQFYYSTIYIIDTYTKNTKNGYVKVNHYAPAISRQCTQE